MAASLLDHGRFCRLAYYLVRHTHTFSRRRRPFGYLLLSSGLTTVQQELPVRRIQRERTIILGLSSRIVARILVGEAIPPNSNDNKVVFKVDHDGSVSNLSLCGASALEDEFILVVFLVWLPSKIAPKVTSDIHLGMPCLTGYQHLPPSSNGVAPRSVDDKGGILLLVYLGE
jgi:hypothetical protein